MPIRMIREDWIESERINSLDAHAERFFLRLILKADDYGRYHAAPQMLKSTLFPMKDEIRSTDMSRCLAACEKVGLVRCYEVAGKQLLEIPRFGQRLRTKKGKFPPPADACQTDDGQMTDICQLEEKGREVEKEGEGEEKESPPPKLDFAKSEDPKPNPNRMATFQQVLDFAGSQPMAISQECCEAFFDRMESEGWVTKQGFPLNDWRARFRQWVTAWTANGNGRRSA